MMLVVPKDYLIVTEIEVHRYLNLGLILMKYQPHVICA